MSTAQNLAYSIVQVAHNLGAVATVGGSIAALKTSAGKRGYAWLALAGWGTQAASGAAFGMVSYYFYHRLPDISGIAVYALLVKMACAAAGFLLLAALLYWGNRWPAVRQDGALRASTILALTALATAAFLRWFS